MVSTIGIVSLSSGIIGEDFVKHEVDLGIQRLKDLGLNPIFLPHSLKGLDFIKDHPEARAEDLIHAFSDDSIDMILCAIGGDDTYRLLPYLFENDQLQKVIKQKIFLGFSDTTMNHLMLHKLGIKTFYGQSFLADICELDKEMLAYSLHYFKELIETGRISEIRPSDVWYEERTDFSPTALGTPRVSHTNTGFDLLQGSAQFEGKSSVVASNPSTISLTTLDTQIARNSAKNTNFSLTCQTGKGKSSCSKQAKKSLSQKTSKDVANFKGHWHIRGHQWTLGRKTYG